MKFKQRIRAICTAGPSDPTRSPSLRNRLLRSGLRTAEIFATTHHSEHCGGKNLATNIEKKLRIPQINKEVLRVVLREVCPGQCIETFNHTRHRQSPWNSLGFSHTPGTSARPAKQCQQQSRQGLPVVVSLSFTNSASILFSSIFIILRENSGWANRIVTQRASSNWALTATLL